MKTSFVPSFFLNLPAVCRRYRRLGTKKPQPTSLLDLPLKLRREVYKYALAGEHEGLPPHLHSLLQILREASEFATFTLIVQYFGRDTNGEIQALARKIRKTYAAGHRLGLHIEIKCSVASGLYLKPLLDVIHKTPMPEVKVTLGHAEGCLHCSSPGRRWENSWMLEESRRVVALAKYQRDNGVVASKPCVEGREQCEFR